MYTVSDAVEMGNAQELILELQKDDPTGDDFHSQTAIPEEYFDQ